MNNFNIYVNTFEKLNPRSMFLSVHRYLNNYGELSNFSVVFHISYTNALKKSRDIIKKISYQRNNNFSANDFNRAKEELLESFENSLEGYNPLYTCQDTYSPILGADKKPIPGVKLHKTQGLIHINALRLRKTVLIPGVYPVVNSRPKTLAKKYLRSFTPLSKWVQFKLDSSKFETIKVEKLTIKS